MKQIFVKYIPLYLDNRNTFYTISHQIKIPALSGKVIIKDEPILGINTPNTIYDFGIIEILDDSLISEVEALIDDIGVSVAMKKITNVEAKQLLLDNGYTEVSPNVIEIRPAYIDDMTGENIEQFIIDFN